MLGQHIPDVQKYSLFQSLSCDLSPSILYYYPHNAMLP